VSEGRAFRPAVTERLKREALAPEAYG
jgi:hypothetical protein